MNNTYVDKIREAGVVGAGGAGFPTHIKVNNKAEVVIANGAECEPLLRVDRQVMENCADKVVEGLKIVMEISGAKRGVICLKEKYHKAVETLNQAIKGEPGIKLYLMGSYYPAGDEQQMVYEVTGKVVPPGGLPIEVGAIVNNVSTLVNIADAVHGIPVTNKIVTVTGEVKNPVTLKVPIGTPLKTLVEIAGGPGENSGYTLIVGGPAMGKVENNWSAPVTKTTGGIIVLPSDHRVVTKKTSSPDKDLRLAKSVCCQCNYCTQLCPRNALGLGVEPHKVMRAVGYGDAEAMGNPSTVFSCCDCGLCTYYACNMDLTPGKMVTMIKGAMAKKGVRPDKAVPYEVSGSREYKKVPVSRFIERLGLGRYDVPAPLQEKEIQVDKVTVPLKQHIGMPAVPQVKPGDHVQKGDLIGKAEETKVGANVHASISGYVTAVTGEYVEISAR